MASVNPDYLDPLAQPTQRQVDPPAFAAERHLLVHDLLSVEYDLHHLLFEAASPLTVRSRFPIRIQNTRLFWEKSNVYVVDPLVVIDAYSVGRVLSQVRTGHGPEV